MTFLQYFFPLSLPRKVFYVQSHFLHLFICSTEKSPRNHVLWTGSIMRANNALAIISLINLLRKKVVWIRSIVRTHQNCKKKLRTNQNCMHSHFCRLDGWCLTAATRNPVSRTYEQVSRNNDAPFRRSLFGERTEEPDEPVFFFQFHAVTFLFRE